MFKVLLTCPNELRNVLEGELRLIGAQEIVQGFKEVHCLMDESVYYKAHFCLRTASHIILLIKECSANSPSELERQASDITWSKFFKSSKTFIVDAIQGDRGRGYMSANDLSKSVRLGVERHFKKYANGQVPRVDLRTPEVRLCVFSLNRRCWLGLNSSGLALHRRGYRYQEHQAPLKESLAAAVLFEAGYDGHQVLLDAMCGSGTIPIEAALLSLKRAPLLNRPDQDFALSHLCLWKPELWLEIREQLSRAADSSSLMAPIYGQDLDFASVEMAKAHAKRAGVSDFVQLKQANFLETEKPAENGILVMNLPYGERLARDQDLDLFYAAIGRHLKHQFTGWTAALLAAETAPIDKIGLKPKKRLPILNGAVKCRLLVYELFSGKRKSSEGNS